MEFHIFGPNISCCLKTGNIFLVIEQKYAPKRPGFKHFLVKENRNCSRKINWIFVAQFTLLQ